MRRRITRLAALLRVADGLDRGHVGAVDRVEVQLSRSRCRIAPAPVAGAGPLRLELWGASRKSGLLGELLDRRVDLVAPDGATVTAGAEDEGE
jgi:exopolyphosphatase/guanosine-5'-triphosphate,3'-diphosphate pyrophosphatase